MDALKEECCRSRRTESPHRPLAARMAHWVILTWGGDAVSVARNKVIQSEQHHPHGQGEHAGQEAVEDQVEEQDESWWGVGGDIK